MEHRIGGIEKDIETGDISYEPENHQLMTNVRKQKIDGISRDIPLQDVSTGQEGGRLVVLGWGSTYGVIHQAVKRSRLLGKDVSHVHLRHIWPMPRNLASLLGSFDKVLIPEMNNGQLVNVIRSEFLIDAKSVSKVSGQPFKISELEAAISDCLEVAK